TVFIVLGEAAAPQLGGVQQLHWLHCLDGGVRQLPPESVSAASSSNWSRSGVSTSTLARNSSKSSSQAAYTGNPYAWHQRSDPESRNDHSAGPPRGRSISSTLSGVQHVGAARPDR